MIGELLQIDQNIAPILLILVCIVLDAHLPRWKQFEEAAMVHGIDPDALVKRSTISLAKDLA